MRIKPLYDRVVVARDKPKDRTDGGVLLPDSHKEKQRPQRATVVAVGEGKNGIPIPLKPNDRVLLKAWAGDPVEADKKEVTRELIVMNAEDILGIIEED